MDVSSLCKLSMTLGWCSRRASVGSSCMRPDRRPDSPARQASPAASDCAGAGPAASDCAGGPDLPPGAEPVGPPPAVPPVDPVCTPAVIPVYPVGGVPGPDVLPAVSGVCARRDEHHGPAPPVDGFARQNDPEAPPPQGPPGFGLDGPDVPACLDGDGLDECNVCDVPGPALAAGPLALQDRSDLARRDDPNPADLAGHAELPGKYYIYHTRYGSHWHTRAGCPGLRMTSFGAYIYKYRSTIILHWHVPEFEVCVTYIAYVYIHIHIHIYLYVYI